MTLFLASYLANPAAAADSCTDFCSTYLGYPCKTLCENEDSCQNLMWTTSERTEVCQFDGSESCPDNLPVKCIEAERLLSVE